MERQRSPFIAQPNPGTGELPRVHFGRARSGVALRFVMPLALAACSLAVLLGLLARPARAALAGSADMQPASPGSPAASKRLTAVAPAASALVSLLAAGPANLPLHVCSIASECYTSVQAAVDAAGDGDVILVAQGRYTGVSAVGPFTQVVYISKSVTLRGGYTTTNWLVSYPLTQPTILDAEGQGRVIYIPSHVTTTIEGFSVTNGFAADYGGGIFIAGGNQVVQNNRVYRNAVSDTIGVAGKGRGGGVYVAGGNSTVQANWIYSNTAHTVHADGGQGGGLYSYDGNSRIIRNTVFGNVADKRGGGAYIYKGQPGFEGNIVYGNAVTSTGNLDGGAGIFIGGEGSLAVFSVRGNAVYSNTISGTGRGAGIHVDSAGVITVERNILLRNRGATYGGGVYFDQPANGHVARNNLIYDNSAAAPSYKGGGIVFFGSYGLIENNTIYSNTGDGIYWESGTVFPIVVRNNLVISNSGNEIRRTGTSITVTYNDLWDSGSADTLNVIFGTGNITANPQFLDPRVDLRLQPGSPAIDAADPISFPDADLTGFGRPFGARADMGALEQYTGACFARIGSGRVYTGPQALIDSATQPTDVIKVAGVCADVFGRAVGGDTFTQTIYVSAGITLRGGYAPTYWSDPITRTVLDAGGLGRAIYITGSDPITVDGFFIVNGSAGTGGGIYLARALSPTIQNVIFFSNAAGSGGGFASEGGGPRLYNNTFVSNTAGITGAGLYLAGSGSPVVRNTIVANNGLGGIVAAGATPALAFNDVWNNVGNDMVGIDDAGAGSLSADPLFVDAAANDFHIRYDSPAVHAGDPNTPVVTDIEGDARPQPGERATWFDIGADESTSHPNVAFEPKQAPQGSGGVGETAAYTYTLTNSGAGPDTYDLTDGKVISGPVSPVGWNVIYPTPLTLAAGESRQVVVNVQVGEAFSSTLATVFVTATSRTQTRVFDVVSNTTFIQSRPFVTVTPSYVENVNPGAVLTYLHTLKNAGSVTDTYAVAWSRSPGWPVIGVGLIPTTSAFTLGPHMTTTLQITLAVQAKSPGGLTETVVLTAQSSFSPSLRAVVSDSFTVSFVPGARHVTTGGDDTFNNCLVATQPCRTIAHAVDQATLIDTVRVAAGTYNEYDIQLNKSATLRGGYNTNFTAWDPRLYPTILDAKGKGRVLYIFGSPVVEGFTLMSGKTTGSGGGVYIGLGSPTLRQNTITSNTAGSTGGGVYVGLATPAIRQNAITSNTATSFGGGVYYNHVFGGSPTWEQNLIAFNTAQRGGGYANVSGSPNFWNNLLYRNSASLDGGGVYVIAGAPRVWHNTLYSNTANAGGGLYLGGGSPLVSHTIVVSNNAVTAGGIYSATASALLDTLDRFGNSPSADVGVGSLPTTSLAVEPRFRNVSGFDFRLLSTSPLKDAGQASAVNIDYWGQPRPVPGGGLPDIGADEYLLAGLSITPNRSGAGVPPGVLTYTHVVTNSGNYSDVITFSARSSQNWSVSFEPPSLTLGLNATGTVVVSVPIALNAISGTLDTTTITATSGNDAEVSAAVVDSTRVGHAISVSLVADQVGLAASGQLKPYVHTLTNRGNYTDTFSLGAFSRNGYTVTFSSSSVRLSGGASSLITTFIQIPASIPITTALKEITTITATSQFSPSVFAVVSDTTYVNRVVSVTLTPNLNGFGIPDVPPRWVNYAHTLKNAGNYTDTFNLASAITYTALTPYWQNWVVTHQPAAVVDLGPGATRTVTASVMIPSATVSNTAIVSGTRATAVITATSEFSPSVSARAVDTTTVTYKPGVLLTPPSGFVCRTTPTQTTAVTFTHWVTNTGNYTDSFVSLATNSEGWAVRVIPTRTVSLAPDAADFVNVEVSVPASPSVTSSYIAVTTTSETDSFVQDTALDSVSFSGRADLIWSPGFSQTTVSDLGVVTVLYTHTLLYTSTAIPTNGVYVSASARSTTTQTWPNPVISPTGVFTLDSGQSMTVTIAVQVPYLANSEPVSITDFLPVFARTTIGCAAQAVNEETSVRRPRVDVYPNRSGSGTPDSLIAFVHTLSNTGGISDTYDVTWSGSLSPAWSVEVLPSTVYTLAPMTETPFTVTLRVPAGILSGTLHTLSVTAQSRFNPVVSDTVKDNTTVTYLPGARIGPERTGQTDPNTVVTYTHRLTNTGNWTETFHLTTQSEFGYAEVSPATIGPLPPGAAYDGIQLAVSIPEHAAGGEVEHTQVIATFAGGQSVAAVDATRINPIPRPRYVAPNGTDLHNNCSTPELYGACATLQHASAQAVPGDEVRAAAGAYTGTLIIDKSLTLQGGYSSSDWNAAPDPNLRPVTLDARGQGRAVSVSGDVTVTLAGLKLTNGLTSGDGGALYINSLRSITLSADVIYSNTAANGGAIFVQSGDLRLHNTILYSNTATTSGGALYLGGSAALEHDTLVNNRAITGGAIYLAGSSLAITNTVFSSNTATITGGAVYSGNAAATVLDYNSWWQNTPDDGNVVTGTNSLAADPSFQNSAANDFHLRYFSMLINRGTIGNVSTDLDGNPRPQIGGYDIGAYEFTPDWRWQIQAGSTRHATDTLVVFAHVLTNTGTYTDQAALTYTLNQPDWSVTVFPTLTPSLGPNMTTTVQLSVTLPVTTPIGTAGTLIVTATSAASSARSASATDVAWYQNDADLAIAKLVAPAGFVGPDHPFTYTLTYTNYGPADGIGVVITDNLPISMTRDVTFSFSGPPITATTGATYVWNVARFGPNTGGRITITGRVSPTLGFLDRVTNIAQIATAQHDMTATNDLASAGVWVDSQPPIRVGTPQVSPANGLITYTQSNTFNWSAGAFDDQGGSGVAGYHLVVSGNAYYSATATSTSFAILDMPLGVYTWTVRAFDALGNAGDFAPAFNLTLDVPNLRVTKYATPTVAVAGAPLTYTLTISNSGPVAATNMVLTDALPANARFLSASANGSHANGIVTWTGLSAGPNNGTVQATFAVSACQPITNSHYRVASSTEGVSSPLGSPVVTKTFVTATITPNFSASASPQAGQPVYFTDTTSANGVIAAWTWGFGDGSPGGSGSAVNHTYAVSGTYPVTLTVRDACGVVTQTARSIAVIGTPDIAWASGSLNVSLPQGSTTTRTLTISNTGRANLTWSLAGQTSWLSAAPAGGTIAPFGSATVVLTYAANTTGAYSTNLFIASNDPDENPVTLPASLSVQVPVITVGPLPMSVALDPDQVAVRTLTISNTGTAPLTISTVTESANWLTATLGSNTVPPSGGSVVTLTFDSNGLTGGQTYSTTLSIFSNDPANPAKAVPVTLIVSKHKVYLPALLKNR